MVIGAGIVGLALARELRRRHPSARVVVFDKEQELGRHASGRNSGVLHSGVYYKSGSLKARMCAEGARELADYCEEHDLPLVRCGKVIVPASEEEDEQLEVLLERAKSNGVRAQLLDERALAKLEPEACSASGRALHLPDAATVEPRTILDHLHQLLRSSGVEVILGCSVESVDLAKGSLTARGGTISFGHLFNAAGLQADKLARGCGVGLAYAMVPFKGLYYRLAPDSGLRIHGLIYPVPDLAVPFLGVHFTRRVGGEIEVGPTAVPAFGRENYAGLRGVSIVEAVGIAGRLALLYARNKQGLRRFARTEAMRFMKARFVEAARRLVPRLQAAHLLRSEKVGIRAQLVNRRTYDLVTDFVIERAERSTHVLNAVSPAFTSAFPFARFVVEEAGVA